MTLDDFLWTPRQSRRRWLLAPGTAAMGIAHVPVTGPHLAEARWLGEEFVVLSVACALLAVAASDLGRPIGSAVAPE